MHAYIDESYDSGAYVLAALVIYDNRSQRAISRITRETLVRFEKHLRVIAPTRLAELPHQRLPELKGAKSRDKKLRVPGLNEYDLIRDEFFRRLVAGANFRLYVLYVDLALSGKWMPTEESKKYSRLLQNIIHVAPIVPPRTKLLTITLDSQNAARPAQQDGQLFTWRKRRPEQRQQRIHDKSRHRSWIQAMNAMLTQEHARRKQKWVDLESARMSAQRLFAAGRLEKAKYEKVVSLAKQAQPGRQVKTKVWTVPSHLDPCLQAVDVLANFSRRYQKLGLRQPPYYQYTPSRSQRAWFTGFSILSERTWWLHNPRLRKSKHPRRNVPQR